jgi:hypothetical protein
VWNLRGHKGWSKGDDGAYYRTDGIRVSLSVNLGSDPHEKGTYTPAWLVQIPTWHGLGTAPGVSYRCEDRSAKLSIEGLLTTLDQDYPLPEWHHR